MNYSGKTPVIFILCILPLLFLTSCKKKPTPPVVTTTNISGFTQTSAVSGGNVEDDGGSVPFSDFLFIAAGLILSAEHISYHIPVKGSTDISPYLSLLRYKSAYEYGKYSNTNMTNEQLSFAAGL